MIAIVVVAGENGIEASVPFDSDASFSLIELFICSSLCFICGLKNSLVTWGTYGKIRVTHLTGLSTDIGLNLIRTFKANQPSPRFKEDRKVNIIRILTFLSFSLGATISAIIIPQIGYRGFLIVFAISFVMTIVSIVDYVSIAKKMDKAVAI
jgi:uncharacterized membrane protein YoaK (UPF0700 family)